MGESFDIPYKSEIRVGPKTITALNKVVEEANNAVENIPKRDLSSTADVQNTITTADTIVKTVQTSFMELLDATNVQTQTEGLTFR